MRFPGRSRHYDASMEVEAQHIRAEQFRLAARVRKLEAALRDVERGTVPDYGSDAAGDFAEHARRALEP